MPAAVSDGVCGEYTTADFHPALAWSGQPPQWGDQLRRHLELPPALLVEGQIMIIFGERNRSRPSPGEATEPDTRTVAPAIPADLGHRSGRRRATPF